MIHMIREKITQYSGGAINSLCTLVVTDTITPSPLWPLGDLYITSYCTPLATQPNAQILPPSADCTCTILEHMILVRIHMIYK